MAKHMADAFGVSLEASACSFDAGHPESFHDLAGYLAKYGLRAGNPNVLTMLLGRPPTTFEQFLTRLEPY